MEYPLLRKADVIRHFGGNKAAVGRACGITRIAVHNWPDLVPELRARRLLDSHPELKDLLLDPVTRLTATEMRARIQREDGP